MATVKSCERRSARAFASLPGSPFPHTGRLRPYPSDVHARMDVKCLHTQGEAWIDLLVATSDTDAILALHPGATLRVRVISLDGGHADRPIARIAQ